MKHEMIESIIIILTLFNSIFVTKSFKPKIVTIKTSIEHGFELAQYFDVLRDDSRALVDGVNAKISILIVSKSDYKRLKKDSQVKIKKSKLAISKRSKNEQQDRFDFNTYPCYRSVKETFKSMEKLAKKFPQLAKFKVIGQSYEKTLDPLNEGHDIQLLVLTSSRKTKKKKSPMFLIGGQHARELTPPEAVLRWAEYLLQNYNIDAEATMILDTTTIYILPISNPDGRAYMEQYMKVFYRKTTHSYGCRSVSKDGVDLNRQYPLHWGDLTGASSDPCAQDFYGLAPLSEPESSSLFDFCRDSVFNASNFKGDTGEEAELKLDQACPENVQHTGLFIDVHSYGQFIFFPYGFAVDAVPPNAQPITTQASKLAFFEESELWGPGFDGFLYPTTGDTTDTMYGMLCVPSYGFEIGTEFYETCSVFENAVLPKVLKALTFAAKSAKNGYTIPLGPDVIQASATSVSLNTLLLEAIVGNYDFHNTRNVPLAGIFVYINSHPYDENSIQPEALEMNIAAITDRDENKKVRTRSNQAQQSNTDDIVATLELNVSDWSEDVKNWLYFVAIDEEGFQGTVLPIFATKSM